MSITVTSEAFENNQPIPTRYTRDGENVSPPLTWAHVPEGTQELALVCDDPDAPTNDPFVHWIACKIPPDATQEEGISKTTQPDTPPGVAQGANSFGGTGYDGPAPPPGHGTHHYHFKLYALDRPIAVSNTIDKTSLMERMKGHIIDEGELVGTYQR